MKGMLEFIGSAGRAADDSFKRLSAETSRIGTPMARPSHPVTIPDCGAPRDTAEVLDVSTSMATPDYPPTRLDGGILAAIGHTDACAQRRPHDRIAVVSFSTVARVVLPLTPVSNKKAIVEAIRQLTAGGGTDLAEGLRAAADLFENVPPSGRQRHVILLTDGEGGRPLDIAARLKRALGVTIDVVGIGGSPSAVNESLLRKVATTEPDGFCRYRFVKDPETLTEHYTQLAKGLVWHGSRK